jgi:uncharacterized protein YjiS (DUF1127 family)
MFITTNATSANLGRPVRAGLRAYFAAALRHSHEKHRVRELQQMSDRMLRDIGVTREQALRERPRPFRDFVF